DTLTRLPTSLNEMYALMVSKIDPNYLPYARAIMQWLLSSVRQLKLEEIATVVGFDFSDERPAFDKDRCFAHPEAVLDVCGGLVVMSQGTTLRVLIHATDRVTLAHLTVKEFLLQQESLLHVNEPDAHSLIAQSCLTYLLDLSQPHVTADVGEFPLHDYAVQNWMEHASSTRDIENTQSVIHKLALEVLHPEYETFQRWSSAWDTIAELLLQNGADLNAQGKDSDTPLRSACSRGHTKIVGLLLQKGVNVNAQGKDVDTPLHSACSGGHTKIVELLLQNGADINAQGKDSDTPLRSACSRGHTKIVELLLQNGADVNAQGEDADTPLRSACSGGHIKIVELLL
ncbi:hypothetical protein PAXINDRAFT_43750, partial [Paxillus involutus ATCC 200175]